MLTPLGTYAKEMTLTLFVGFDVDGVTAGASTKRGKPLPLPLMVGSTQSAIGTAGPVYGYRKSTAFLRSFGAALTEEAAKSAPRTAVCVVVFIVAVQADTMKVYTKDD